jgi:hypothetical protein
VPIAGADPPVWALGRTGHISFGIGRCNVRIKRCEARRLAQMSPKIFTIDLEDREISDYVRRCVACQAGESGLSLGDFGLELCPAIVDCSAQLISS